MEALPPAVFVEISDEVVEAIHHGLVLLLAISDGRLSGRGTGLRACPIEELLVATNCCLNVRLGKEGGFVVQKGQVTNSVIYGDRVGELVEGREGDWCECGCGCVEGLAGV